MSESARFELVDGATFQLPDGSSVTVRDGQLELSDGRRLPMPAAGEAITVERTVTRPDGGTTRIKHTIRLSETEPIVETPARPFAGAGPGSDEEDAGEQTNESKQQKETVETIPAPVAAAVAEAAPPAGPVSDSQQSEEPTKEPAAAQEAAGGIQETPLEHTLMGVNCGRRSLREMLWGSIPESGLEGDMDEPKAPSKGLLNKSYSIKEEDESEHEDGDEPHEEALESSENADESFEFVEGKGKDADKPIESEARKEPKGLEKSDGDEDQPKDPEQVKKENAPEKEEPKQDAEPAKEQERGAQGDTAAKVTFVTFNTASTSEAAPQKADVTNEETSGNKTDEPNTDDKPVTNEEPVQETAHDTPSAELLAEQAVALMASTASVDRANEPSHEKPHLVRQEKLPSSGNLVAQAGDDIVVRVGVPLVDAAPGSKPAEAAPAGADSKEESTASLTSDGAAPAAPLSDEVTHDLHLKLTPILRSLETDEPKSAAADDVSERAPKSAPSEDRKGTVPPNTPAVAEDRDCLLGADEPEPEPEPVSVPKVVSYYESISPRASPAPTRPPRETEACAVPKVIKFAVPMEPEKVYLGGQEPEEMEDTAIPRAAEPPAHIELAPEPAALRQQTQVLIPVRGTPDDLDPLSALVVSETSTQPSAPEEKSDDPATPSTTPEKDVVPEPAQDASRDTTPAEADGNQQKPAPPVYNPELFEPEPKRPLILTSEMVDEDAPPYEPGVHDARTLPIGRKTAVVTEQPPPFGDDDRSDPRDPFLPDNPRPGANLKNDGWLSCFDLCCCCWAP